jgi:phospholipase D1/2
LSVLLQRFLGGANRKPEHEGAPGDADKPRASDEAQRANRLRERGEMPREAAGDDASRRAGEVRS